MQNTLDKITQMKLIPVVAIQDAGHSDRLADALIAGGLPCAEITFRTAAAQDAVGNLAKRGDMLVGAGTVLTVDQAKAAIDAGATFIVAPGFNPKVVRYCLGQNIPMTPGVATPTDIEAAMEMGLEMLKFFPAEALGGIKTLKAISAPYTKARFIPTGGINTGNVVQYLKHPSVVACGGSWMVTSALIADEQFDRITSLTREAVTLVKNLYNENK
ncbi:MAG: bifunctional 4-hydroxy-2-oxoglutarate aldolase/2-dehydro-3-deoxy-phosphogluconate aldolase [Desulfobacteraceae bacterium]|jgi:2-dehydro-3-deoxyphosphogluconate aldolase/(4S)-4-hydroxy-2-oxoglutarate aldolase